MNDPLLDRLVVAVGTQYLVDAEIGRGGMAVVYRATDLRLHRRVAIKVLPPELAFNADVRERFLREAQTSARLAHPSIVPIYTVDEREGIVYFVMALVDGESLAQRLVREPRLPIAEARTLLAGVADALSYAHSQGVVHRDVKPDNIMLDMSTGRPMVTDFGIARAAQGDTRLTVTGVAIGTPAYMSPEQALGERELDGRSDIYSLGIIGYQLLAGETPFKASNTPAMLVKHVSESPRPLSQLRPDVPPALGHAIARALAKKPDDRWADAAAFRDALLDTRDLPQQTPAWPTSQPPEHRFTEQAPQRPDQRYRESAPLPPDQRYRDSAPLPPRLMPDPRFIDPQRVPGIDWMNNAPLMPPMPAAPVWGSKADWREWKRARKRWELEQRRRSRAMGRSNEDEEYAGLTVDEQLVRFRRKAIGSVATIGSLAAVNLLTSPHFLWFLFPTAAISLGMMSRAGKLWADGVPLRKIFTRGTTAVSGVKQPKLPPRMSITEAAQRIAPIEILDGHYGEIVRRAAADHIAVRDTLARLPDSERDMIPDVAPTVDALAERVGALATTLHRLDADVGGASPQMLDARLQALRAETRGSPTPEQERRIALLERQRASIGELSERRAVLASQLESAALALQNLRLDLLKLRSSGLESAMSDVASATQEARALSREIGNAVDAVREVRGL
ncbi:MAG: protein kinase [Gemmatimonadetes bacterium]|nr:protein kinase [Gemmatimonadota bacterium]